MKDIVIRNNAKNLQLLVLYEKIKAEDTHPMIDRISILDRALDFAIENKPDFRHLAAVKFDFTHTNQTKLHEFIHIKASEEKIDIVSEMIRGCFDISIVQIPFLVKLVLTGYYIEKIKNQNNNTKIFSERNTMNTTRIRRALAELTLALAEIEGQSIEAVLDNIRKDIDHIN